LVWPPMGYGVAHGLDQGLIMPSKTTYTAHICLFVECLCLPAAVTKARIIEL
jgi:hypothetical protein